MLDSDAYLYSTLRLECLCLLRLTLSLEQLGPGASYYSAGSSLPDSRCPPVGGQQPAGKEGAPALQQLSGAEPGHPPKEKIHAGEGVSRRCRRDNTGIDRCNALARRVVASGNSCWLVTPMTGTGV